ncbi:phenylalanine--tRNA ligase [Balamuthia mandrillaris]
MPTISVKEKELFEALGQKFTEQEFFNLCFEYGIELDEVTTEKDIQSKEQRKEAAGSEDVIYKIEIPANRYDLLCLEGLTRALRVFLGKEKPTDYHTYVPEKVEQIIVKEEVLQVRPHVVCAILRDISFTPSSYASFIELQEKLHQNICRKRTLVSIGTHDLDTIQGPFTYDARQPNDINFTFLNYHQELNAQQIMEELSTNPAYGHLKPYLPIIRDEPRYPVIYDKNGVVLSLPPIINGDHSKITLSTKNVFIEVTATDLTKANVVLNTMVTMFSQYCAKPFLVEVVETVLPSGEKTQYPDLSNREQLARVDYINKSIGIDLGPQELIALLDKMSLPAVLSADASQLSVVVPPTRSDILHACDVMEDVAIAYGFNNLKVTVPNTTTVGKQQPLNKLTDLLRAEVAQAGYTEILTLSLCSTEENFKFLQREDDGSAVKIANPKTAEFQVGRTTLLVGALKTLSNNKNQPLPIKIFEISDVMLIDPSTDVGARNNRNLCAIYCNTTSGFEVIHGLLDRLMLLLGVSTSSYSIQPSEDPSFFQGRRADVLLNGKKVGVFGIVHPVVLKNFDLVYPCSALELELEPFLALKLGKH